MRDIKKVRIIIIIIVIVIIIIIITSLLLSLLSLSLHYRITRHCPGEKAKDILSSSSSSKDPMDNKKFLKPFDNHHIHPFDEIFGDDHHKDPFGIIDSIFQQIMGSTDIFNNEHNNNRYPGVNVPKRYDDIKPNVPHNYKPVIPPHKAKENNDNVGSISGPIEKV